MKPGPKKQAGRLIASFWYFRVFVFNLNYQKVIDKAKDYKAKVFWTYTFGRLPKRYIHIIAWLCLDTNEEFLYDWAT
jgi:hypothetical protein